MVIELSMMTLWVLANKLLTRIKIISKSKLYFLPPKNKDIPEKI